MIQVRLYRMNSMDFLTLEGAEKGKVYPKELIEKLCGFELADNAADSLARFGFIRVCKGSHGSYRVD